MRVFRIPVWNSNTGITHIATSWQIASDPDFNNIIQEVVDSTKYLDYWSVSVVVPDGVIYYVRAKRKFAEVANSIWIGPKKVVSDDTGVSEIIKPELKIETPYIDDYSISTNSGLTVNLTPYSGNVPHVATSWIFKNYTTGKIVYKSLLDTNNLTSITVSPNDVDFTEIDYLTLVVVYHGNLGVESSPIKEVIKLYERYFKIEANKDIVPTGIDYKGKVVQLTNRLVTLQSAELYNIEGTKIADGTIDGNTYTFPAVNLVPYMSYKVKLTLYYDNDTTKTVTVSYSFFTKSVTEKIIFNKDRLYNRTYNILRQGLPLVLDNVDDDLNKNGINWTLQLLTEEFYAGIIPFITRSNELKAYFFDNDKFGYIKPIYGFNKEFKTYFKVELTPDNIMYIDTVKEINGVDTKVLYVYKFNPYTFDIEYLGEYDRSDEYITDFNTNAYGVLNGEFYWSAIDINDRTKVMIKKFNKDTNTIDILYHDRLDPNTTTNIDNVMFTRLPTDEFMVIPQYYNDSLEYYGYIYDISRDEMYKLFTIPEEIRSTHNLVTTLDNGCVFIGRVNLDNGNLYYVLIDNENNVTTNYENLNIDVDTTLQDVVRLKSGNILQFGYNGSKGTLLLWS